MPTTVAPSHGKTNTGRRSRSCRKVNACATGNRQPGSNKIDAAPAGNVSECTSHQPRQQDAQIEVANRKLHARHEADGIVWFAFKELCETARSQYDYMELSRCYHTVLLSGVKAMGRQNDDVARRFIALVDECYDRGCLLLLTSAVAISELYQAKQL